MDPVISSTDHSSHPTPETKDKGKGRLSGRTVTDQTEEKKSSSGGISGWFWKKTVSTGAYFFSGVNWLEKRNQEKKERILDIVRGNEEIIEQVETLANFLAPQITTVIAAQDAAVGEYLEGESGRRILNAYFNSILLQITLNLMENHPPESRLLEGMISKDPSDSKKAMTEYTARLLTHFIDPLVEFEKEITTIKDNPTLVRAKFKTLIKEILRVGFQKENTDSDLKQDEIDVMNTNLIKLGGKFTDFLSLSKLENVVLPEYFYNFYVVYQKIDEKFGLSSRVHYGSPLGQFVTSLSDAAVNLAPGLVGDINLLDPRQFDFLNGVATKILRNPHQDMRIEEIKNVIKKYMTSALYQYFFHLTMKDVEMSGSLRAFKFDKNKGLIETLTELAGDSNLTDGLLGKILNDLTECLNEQQDEKKRIEGLSGEEDAKDLANQLQIIGIFIRALENVLWFLEDEVRPRLESIDHLNQHFGKMKQGFIEALLDARILGGTEAIPFVRAVSKISAGAASNKIRKILTKPDDHRKDLFKKSLERMFKPEEKIDIEVLREKIKMLIDSDDKSLKEFVEKHVELGLFKILYYLISINPEESDKKHLGRFTLEKIGELYNDKSKNIQDKMSALFELFHSLDAASTSKSDERFRSFRAGLDRLIDGAAQTHAAVVVSRLEWKADNDSEEELVKSALNLVPLVQQHGISDHIGSEEIRQIFEGKLSHETFISRFEDGLKEDAKATVAVLEEYSKLFLGFEHNLDGVVQKLHAKQLKKEFNWLSEGIKEKNEDEIEDYKDEIKLRILRIEVVDMLDDLGIDENLITIDQEEGTSVASLDYRLMSKVLFNAIVDFATLNYLYPYYEEIYTPLNNGEEVFSIQTSNDDLIRQKVEDAARAIVDKVRELLQEKEGGKAKQIYADMLQVNLDHDDAQEKRNATHAVTWLKTAMGPFLEGEESKIWQDIHRIAASLFKYFSARLLQHSPQVGSTNDEKNGLEDPHFIFKSITHVFKKVIKDYITKEKMVDTERPLREAFYHTVSEKVLDLALNKLNESEKDFPVPDTYSQDLQNIWGEKGPELIEELIGPYMTPEGRNRVLMQGLLKVNEQLDPHFKPDRLIQQQSNNEHLNLEDSKEILRGLVKKTVDKAVRSQINNYWTRWKTIKAGFFNRHPCLKVFKWLSNLLDAIAMWLFTNLYNHVLPIAFYPLVVMRNKVIEKGVDYISRDEVGYWCEDAILEAFELLEEDYPYRKSDSNAEDVRKELNREMLPAFNTLVQDHLNEWYLFPVRKTLRYSGINQLVVKTMTGSMKRNLEGQSAYELTLDGIIEGLKV